MSQVVAMRAIQSSILSPTSESAHRRTAFKLKPPTSFSYKVMAFEEKQRGWSWRLFGNRRSEITAKRPLQTEVAPVSPEDSPKIEEQWKAIQQLYDPAVSMWSKPVVKRKTKIVCSIGPSTNTREMIWKLAVGSNCSRTSIRRMMPHMTSKVQRSGGLRKIDDFTISVLSTVKPDHAAILVIVFIIEYIVYLLLLTPLTCPTSNGLPLLVPLTSAYSVPFRLARLAAASSSTSYSKTLPLSVP